MIELTTEDWERIEQEAMAHSTLGKNYLGETLYDSKAHDSFKEGAEYATRYEREQQSSLQQEADIKQRALEINAKTIMKLEAERSELRNKVIEECINAFSEMSDVNITYAFVAIVSKLNSLKK